jgi:lambda family phage holin
MHDKIEWLKQLFDTLVPEDMRAALFSVFVAWLRINYDSVEPRLLRRILEALLCGTITYMITSSLLFLNLPEGSGWFIGGSIGMLGADYIRVYIAKSAKKFLAARGISDDTKER